MKKLNITFCSFPDYAGNAKALYEYMIKRYKNNMNYTWIVYNESTVELLKENNINAILIGTDEFKKYIPKTDVFFTTHANLSGDKIKAKNSVYVELWHGIGPKPIGFLTNNLSKQDEKWYDYLSEVIDYLIVPSEFWKYIFCGRFNLKADRIKALGLPLLDEIKNSNGKENLEKVLNININDYNKIILYAPTFRKGCGRELEGKYNEQTILNLNDYSDEELNDYLKEKNYLLIVKRHPSDECVYKQIENDNIKNINNDMLEELGLNVNNIINAVDLLITDYSSLGTEFSFLDRPVIYLSTDLEEYKKNRGILLNDYSFWTNDIMTDNYNDLVNKINSLINKKSVLKNKKFIYGDLKDGGCDKICDFLFDNNKISSRVVRYRSQLVKLNEENKQMKYQIEEQTNTIKKLTESDIELKQIKNSKSYKIIEKIRKTVRRK
jgi:CDP-glycerol glycerophosphotransferase (TagB/SpsB family)